jgi:hypothetical protein
VSGCWKRGIKEKWCDRTIKLTPATWENIHRRWQELDKERCRVKVTEQAQAGKKAAWIAVRRRFR